MGASSSTASRPTSTRLVRARWQTPAVAEEVGWKVRTGPILDSWLYHVAAVGKDVFIVTYGCYLTDDAEPVLSHEHKEVELLEQTDIPLLKMPAGYKRSVMSWFARLSLDLSTK
jgi:hypothetical protein